MTGEDHGAPVNEWVNVVRRARLGESAKSVAFAMATYADRDGTKVFAGVARLAFECEMNYRTVQRALAELRRAGLIEVTRRGNRRAGKSDEYRLTLAADLLERLDVPTPAAASLAIEEIRHRYRGKHRQKPPLRQPDGSRPVDNPDCTSPVTPDKAPGAADCTSPVTREMSIARHSEQVLHVTRDAPPSIGPFQVDQPPSDEASADGTRTGSAREAATDESGYSSSGRPSPRTAEETAAEARRQADALTAWQRAQAANGATP